ncbi:retrovirus-related pol polyprotein from transposon TNT 1-94 [Tanacetum coccineum]
MYKLDLVTLAPKDKNNKETHIYYLKHTMEQAAILRKIVERAKSLNPLDSASYSAYKYVKLIQELLGYIRDTCPDIHKPSEKLVAITPINKKKIVRFAEPIISSSTSQKQLGSSQTKTKQTTNNSVSTSTGVSRSTKSSSSMFDARHELCFLEFVSDMNASSKSKSVKKAKKKEVWKPTGKVFTKIGYNWRLTGRIFTLVGNACPLIRFTDTNKVPLRELIPLEVVAQEYVVTKVYTRRPKVPKTNGSNSKPKIEKSVISNKMEPGTSRGSNTSVATSSSSIVDLSNDQIAKITGYGNYRIGNIIISRIYYVEGLGHNLFSVGQFCDSDLKVAFKKHMCFVRNLEGVDLLSGSREINLYTLSIGDMMASFPICLLSKASKTKSWLWHRRLSHLKFGAINHLAKNGLVRVPVANAPRAVDLADSPMSTSIDQDAPSTSILSTQDQEQFLIISQGFEESPKIPHFHDDPLHVSLHKDSTSQGSSSNVRPIHTPFESLGRWTKDHPLANVIRDPSRSVSTKKQL